VGNDNRPASGQEISEIEEKLKTLFAENNVDCIAIVTHHACEIRLIE
jgi:hypothetical protein